MGGYGNTEGRGSGGRVSRMNGPMRTWEVRCSRREALTLQGRSGISEAMNASAGMEVSVPVRYFSTPATFTYALRYWSIFIKRLGYLGHCLMFIASFIA